MSSGPITPEVAEAVALLYEASSALRRQVQENQDAADRLFRVASALHDLAVEANRLRSVG